MTTTNSTVKKPRSTLTLRVSPVDRELIDRAAQSAGKTRTDFILEAARRAAEDTLLDRALLVISLEAHGECLLRLDQRAEPSAQLRRTMRSKTPWQAP